MHIVKDKDFVKDLTTHYQLSENFITSCLNHYRKKTFNTYIQSMLIHHMTPAQCEMYADYMQVLSSSEGKPLSQPLANEYMKVLIAAIHLGVLPYPYGAQTLEYYYSKLIARPSIKQTIPHWLTGAVGEVLWYSILEMSMQLGSMITALPYITPNNISVVVDALSHGVDLSTYLPDDLPSQELAQITNGLIGIGACQEVSCTVDTDILLDIL